MERPVREVKFGKLGEFISVKIGKYEYPLLIDDEGYLKIGKRGTQNLDDEKTK